MASDIILYTIPLGLGVAASHRIGNLLGSGHASGAKFAIRMPYIFALILGIIEFVLIMSVKNWFGYIFSTEEAVVRLTAQVLPLMACFQILDLGNGGACGILRGAGKVHLAGVSNIIAYYGVSMTTAWYLCFTKELGVFGLWSGMITGSAVLLVIQTLWIVMINWEKEAELVSEQDHGIGIK
jgi:MATE family multidrug resistance protein